MAVAGPAVALSNGAFEHYERLGPLPNYLRCSALVIGVAELFQQKHPIARKPGSTMACLPVDGGSGGGCSRATYQQDPMHGWCTFYLTVGANGITSVGTI